MGGVNDDKTPGFHIACSLIKFVPYAIPNMWIIPACNLRLKPKDNGASLYHPVLGK